MPGSCVLTEGQLVPHIPGLAQSCFRPLRNGQTGTLDTVDATHFGCTQELISITNGEM